MKTKGRKEKFQKLNDSSIDITALAELGLTDKEISKVLGISTVTLNAYKKKYPNFLNSLKKGKEVSDKNVIVSLYQRATGYSHPDIHISNYQGKITITPIIKYYPPDPFSIVYWLNNRQPETWKNRREEVSGLNEDETKILKQEALKLMQNQL